MNTYFNYAAIAKDLRKSRVEADMNN